MQGTKRNLYGFTLALLLLFATLLMYLPAIVKAAAPGALDSGFGAGGKVITDVGGNDFVGGLAVQPDGKIIVVGRANLGGGGAAFDFAVVRYNSNGTLDTTFDGDGKVTTDFFGTADLAAAVTIQADRKIVVVGRSGPVGGMTTFALARYNPNGSLDTSFDGDGKLIADIVAGVSDQAYRVASQADGKLVVVGFAGPDFALARFNLDGSWDNSFDFDGRLFTDFGGAADFAWDVAILPDGKILAGGDGNSDFGLARYNPNGSLDTTFDMDGLVTTDMSGGYDRIDSFAVQADGKIVGVGRATVGGDEDTALARYNADGSLDITFDGDGRVITDVSPGMGDQASGVGVEADGRIVIAGSTNIGGGGDFAASRYNANGSLDTSFGRGGIAIKDISGDDILQAALLSGDKLVVTGLANAPGDFALARFNLNTLPSQSADFDGDGVTDLSVFRPSTGGWYTLTSSNNTFTATLFGLNGDVPVDGDFDGDSRADFAVFRPSGGNWYIMRSSDNSFQSVQWGANGDRPVPGDYDRDGRTDIAVFRPNTGGWFILRSSNNTIQAAAWGQNGDIPLPASAQ